MSLIVPFLLDKQGSGEYEEEIDVSQYYSSDYGTIVAKLARYGRISCIAFRLKGNVFISPALQPFERLDDVIYQSVSVADKDLDIIKKITSPRLNMLIQQNISHGGWFSSGVMQYAGSHKHQSLIYLDEPLNQSGEYPFINTVRVDFANISDEEYGGVVNIDGSIMFINRYEG